MFHFTINLQTLTAMACNSQAARQYNQGTPEFWTRSKAKASTPYFERFSFAHPDLHQKNIAPLEFQLDRGKRMGERNPMQPPAAYIEFRG